MINNNNITMDHINNNNKYTNHISDITGLTLGPTINDNKLGLS